VAGLWITAHGEVNVRMSECIWPLALYQLPDACYCVSAALLRAAGKQSYSTPINAVGFFMVALPLAWHLGVTRDMQLSGVWLGLLIGHTLNCLLTLFALFALINWRSLAWQLSQSGGSAGPRSSEADIQTFGDTFVINVIPPSNDNSPHAEEDECAETCAADEAHPYAAADGSAHAQLERKPFQAVAGAAAVSSSASAAHLRQ
jgi:hypothetical protein